MVNKSGTAKLLRALERADSSRDSDSTPAVVGARLTAAAAGKYMRYEEMMERFQVRRLQSSLSPDTSRTGGELSRQASSIKYAPESARTRSRHASGGDDTFGHKSGHTPKHSQYSMHRGVSIERNLVQRATADGDAPSDLADTPHPLVFHDPQSLAARLQHRKMSDAPTSTWILHERPRAAGFSLHRTLKAWRQSCDWHMRQLLARLTTPLSPHSATAYVRNMVLVLLLGLYIVYYPLEVAFAAHHHEGGWYKTGIQTLEIVLLVDFALAFNTSFATESGELVTSRLEITKHVVLRGTFLPRLMPSIPLHILFQSDLETLHRVRALEDIEFVLLIERLAHALWVGRFLWFVRLNRSGRGVWAWLVYSKYSHLFRIIWIVFFILLVAHYMACAWKMLGGGHYSDASSPVQVYASSFYDALQLLQGQGVPTTTTTQSIFASFAVLLGSIVLAIVFDHVAVLVSNFNANAANYQRKMEAVFVITFKMQLPEPLRERIHQYYDHLWCEYESLDGEIERFSKSLSHTLELEVVLCKYMELVMRVPFWDDCSPDFQKQLMLNLRVRVYLPDDFVIRRGEVDDEFYMINRGSVELVIGSDSFERPVGSYPSMDSGTRSPSHDASDMTLLSHRSSTHRGSGFEMPTASHHRSRRPGPTSPFRVHAAKDIHEQHGGDACGTNNGSSRTILSRGQAIGEMALLMNYQRTADVRAATHVEMCVLSRKDFQRILTKHPGDRSRVVTAMLTATMLNNEAKGVFCPLKDMVHTIYEGEDPATGKSLGAAAAASLILDVISPDVEDKSIKFGVNAHLKQQLLAKRNAGARTVHRGASLRSLSRDTSARVASRGRTDEVAELPSVLVFDAAATVVALETARALLSNPPSTRMTPAVGDGESRHIVNAPSLSTGASQPRIERIERTLDTLVDVVAEIRSALDRSASVPSSHVNATATATAATRTCGTESDRHRTATAAATATTSRSTRSRTSLPRSRAKSTVSSSSLPTAHAAPATTTAAHSAESDRCSAAAATTSRSSRSSNLPPQSRAKSTVSSSSHSTAQTTPVHAGEMSARPLSSQIVSESLTEDAPSEAQMQRSRLQLWRQDGDNDRSERVGAGDRTGSTQPELVSQPLPVAQPHPAAAVLPPEVAVATTRPTPPRLVRRLGSIIGISKTASALLTAAATASSTPFADQLFKTRPHPLIFRHSAESNSLKQITQ